MARLDASSGSLLAAGARVSDRSVEGAPDDGTVGALSQLLISLSETQRRATADVLGELRELRRSVEAVQTDVERLKRTQQLLLQQQQQATAAAAASEAAASEAAAARQGPRAGRTKSVVSWGRSLLEPVEV